MDSITTILTTICTQVEEGTPPTFTDLAETLGCSRTTAHRIVHGLINKGYLEQAGTTRTLTLTQAGLLRIGRI